MRTIVIGTAGHIDHGKSALVKAITGTDPDRLKEERDRGITIDLGFAHLDTGDVSLSFVDVPGHERFVRNMLAGAGGIDAVLLVVAADESVKPQTREHLDIVRLIGIDRGVVALSKADLADGARRELAALDVTELVAGTFLESAPIIPVSAKTGEGLRELVDALRGLGGAVPRLARAGSARLPVDRVFSVKGFGTVVTGTLVSGRLAEGDTLVILPEGREVRVRGLQVHGRAARQVAAPSRVAVNLTGVEAGTLSRGVTVASADSLAVTRHADVRLRLLPGAPPLRHGARLRVHHGTSDEVARVALAALRPAGEAWRPARPGELGVTVPPGGEAFARFRFERPAVLTRGDRLVLRRLSPVATIGGATVLDPEAVPGGVRRRGALEQFERLEDETAAPAVWLADAAGRGLAAATFVRRGGRDAATAAAIVADLVASGAATAAGGRVFDARFAEQAVAEVRRVLAEFHRGAPAEAGMPREALREQAAARLAPAFFDALLDRLRAGGDVVLTDRVALATHRPARSEGDDRARAAIEARLKEADLIPPELALLADAVRVPAHELERLLQGLARDRRIVRLDGVPFHPDALERLKADVRAMRGAGSTPATIDVATFKARYGLSRKYAIPLLEWLDRERVTRRMGERRVVL